MHVICKHSSGTLIFDLGWTLKVQGYRYLKPEHHEKSKTDEKSHMKIAVRFDIESP